MANPTIPVKAVDAARQSASGIKPAVDDHPRPEVVRLVNRAGESKSPYVRGHRNNPVAWQLWNTESIALAKKLDRLIFLSIGYSACHWCHVMARESFSNPEIAAILNDSFIPIKLDREERPDIDDVYMNYVEATNGTGGWPLNVFLTPDLEPVFGGTYWPSSDSTTHLTTVTPLGEEVPVVSFNDILEKLREVWVTQEWRCRASAQGITQQLRDFAEEGTHSTPAKEEDEQGNAVVDKTEVTAADLEIDLLEEAYQNFAARFDPENGGFGLEPKFPMPTNLSFLLRLARYPESTPVADVVGPEECSHAAHMAVLTLIAMARGGLHDHVGHGFSRYSITRDWSLPHFEKILSDQAQLLDVYLDAFEVSGHPELLGAVYDLVTYLTSPPIFSPRINAFYCSEDADSLPLRPDSSSSSHSEDDDIENHKHEGAFYTWTRRELVKILGNRDAEVCAAHWGVKADGNIPRHHDPADEFLNQNVLSIRTTPSVLARDFGLSEDEVVRIIKSAKQKLDEYRRTRRVPPDIDDKVVAGWNGLAIHALARASVVLSEIDEGRARTCLDVAERCMRFVQTEMMDASTGQLWRVWRSGNRADTPGFAEDYACLCHAAISLYYATFDDKYLQFADQLQGYLDKHFLSHDDPLDSAKSTGYYTTPSPLPPNVPAPLLRLKQGTDAATPAANGLIVRNLLRLASLLNDGKYKKLAAETVTAFAVEIQQHPFLFVGLLDGIVGLEVDARGIIGVVGRGKKAVAGAAAKKEMKGQEEEDDDPTPRPRPINTEATRSEIIRAAREVAGPGITTCSTTIALLDASRPEQSAWLRSRNDLLRDVIKEGARSEVLLCEEGSCKVIASDAGIDTKMERLQLA